MEAWDAKSFKNSGTVYTKRHQDQPRIWVFIDLEVGLHINDLADLLATGFRCLLIISVSLLVLEIYLILFCQFICFRNLLIISSQFIGFINLLFYYHFVSFLVLEIYLLLIFVSLSVIELYILIIIFISLLVCVIYLLFLSAY